MCRKTTGSQGCKGIGKCIYKIHSAEQKCNHLCCSQTNVQKPEGLRRTCDFWCNLTFFRTAAFCLYQSKSANSKKRKKCYSQRDYSHASKPVHLAPPQINASWKFINSTQNCGSGGRKTAYAFKNCVNYAFSCSRQN